MALFFVIFGSMRLLLTLVLILLMSGCSDTNDFREDTELIEVEKDEFLEGTWGMTNYFDTIVKYNQVAKYRLQRATWFAILLEFKGDSLFTYGTIDENSYKIEVLNDTITKLHARIGNKSDYWLVKRDTILILKQINEVGLNDSLVYIFRKRPDLNYLVNNNEIGLRISNNVTNYFNQELFSGTYNQYFSSKKMSFKPNGDVVNWSKYDSYEIDNYFGTSHPFGNFDVVTLSNLSKNKRDYYSWKFQGDSLILTELISEEVLYEGEIYETDDWVESDNIQILLKAKY